MTGLAVLYNKSLKIINIYSISFDCLKIQELPKEPHRLQLEVDKIAILEVKQPLPSNLNSNTVNLLEWNHNYKSEVDRLWD